jgi:hypothetical protein
MISLTHITEAELRQFYLLEGKISGRDKEINMFNGVQQEYVASRIHDFIIWNDPPNKSKFELYIKENLPKMEIKYDIIKQEQIRKEQEQRKEQIRKEQEQKQELNKKKQEQMQKQREMLRQKEMLRQRQELNNKKQEQRQNVLQTNTIIINNNYYNNNNYY